MFKYYKNLYKNMYIGFAETPSNTPETTSLKDTKDSYSD
jgi:hypothetical protein